MTVACSGDLEETNNTRTQLEAIYGSIEVQSVLPLSPFFSFPLLSLALALLFLYVYISFQMRERYFLSQPSQFLDTLALAQSTLPLSPFAPFPLFPSFPSFPPSSRSS
jgi:hypothetical protein